MPQAPTSTVVYILVIAPYDHQSVVGPFSSPTAAIQWAADNGLDGNELIMSPQQILENFHTFGGLPIYHPGEYRA